MRTSRLLRFLPVLAIGVIALALAACGTSVPSSDTPVEPEAVRPRVLFDMGHGEIFGAEDTDELGQSIAVQHIRDSGYNVVISKEQFTPELLSGSAGVILAGPMVSLAASELDALEEYVRDGGVLLVTTHVPFSIEPLLARFGANASAGIVRRSDAKPGEDPGVLIADGIAEDVLTENVTGVLVLSGWVVRAEGPEARVVVSTSANTWADVDGDNIQTEADPTGPFGAVVVTRVGAGTVILSGDDAIFANEAIGYAGNLQLLDNIIRVMGSRTRPS